MKIHRTERAGVMFGRVGIVMALVAFINMVDTLAYGARLAGARTRSPSLAMSLFNIVALSSRTANLIQLPLVASIVDIYLQSGKGNTLLDTFRLILFSNSLGVLMGIILLPFSVKAFTWGIIKMEQTHSIPVVAISLIKRKNLKKVKHIPITRWRHINILKLNNLPRAFILSNPVLTAFYSVGVLAAIYAGFLIPEYRLTASQLSGLINGVATIFLVTIVDPVSAMILDDTLKGKRSESELKSAIGFLAVGKFFGTLLAQLLLVPAAHIIVLVTRLLLIG